ncbi:MAG: type II secretion system protein GspK [Kiritimatiellae bacterium]|nr:type II secretion system protein GspK [Kiritimatiellia bacterium]
MRESYFSNGWNFSKKGLGGVGAGSGASGSALIVALWVLLLLSLLIGGFAFEMHIEAGITSHQRKKLHAQYLSRGGVEYARMLLVRSAKASEDDVASSEENESLVDNALRLSRGVTVSGMSIPLGRGRILLDVVPEEGRRNVNKLTDEEWEELLDQAGVPEDDWGELIDCFTDWVDEGDEHQLNGAESDDAFYEDAGYECKNAPLDTVDELLLIKGFTREVVYGERATEENPAPMTGIARHLTTWGDGRINVNTASREVLMTLPGMDEWVVDEIIDGRVGDDGEAGTRDDGWESVDAVLAEAGLSPELRDKITVKDKQYVRVVSRGEVGNVRAGIWCIMEMTGDTPKPVFWREEFME